MIIRILEDAQYELGDAAAEALDPLDDALDGAIRSGDETAFRAALDAAISIVREHGTPLDPDRLSASDLVLPPDDATLEEARTLLSSEAGEHR